MNNEIPILPPIPPALVITPTKTIPAESGVLKF